MGPSQDKVNDMTPSLQTYPIPSTSSSVTSSHADINTDSVGTQDALSRYAALKRRFAELEEKPKETAMGGDRSDERNVRMREERSIIQDRILELENQPGFVIPLGFAPSSTTSLVSPSIPCADSSTHAGAAVRDAGEGSPTNGTGTANASIEANISTNTNGITSLANAQESVLSSKIDSPTNGTEVPSTSARQSTPRTRRSSRITSKSSPQTSSPSPASSRSRRPAAPTSPIPPNTHSNGESSSTLNASTAAPTDLTPPGGSKQQDSDASRTSAVLSSNPLKGLLTLGTTALPPPPGQTLAALLSSPGLNMQIDPALMDTTGLKNVIGMGFTDTTSTESKVAQSSSSDKSGPPDSTSQSTVTPSTSTPTSNPSSQTPSSAINPYSLLYGAMSPLSAVPTTPSSAASISPTLPYPGLYYPFPFQMPPGMFTPPSGLVPANAQPPQPPPPRPQEPPRQNKPKRLKAHTVTTKSFSIPMVPRDKSGKPMLPLNVGIMTVISLGEVCMREHFHTERYIFPVGYEVTRRYLSTIDPNREVVYHCTILDGGDGPKFQIVPSDTADRPVIAGTATGAWSSIVKQANAIRNRQHSNSVSGPDFFGLGQNTIKHLIQELPNANRLRDYVWQNFVEGGPLGGRHAAVIPALPEDYDAAHPIGPYYPSAQERLKQAGPSNTPTTESPRSYYPPHVIQEAAHASGTSSETDRGSSNGPSPSPTTTSRGKRKASGHDQPEAVHAPSSTLPADSPTHPQPQYVPTLNPPPPSIPPFPVVNGYPAPQSNGNIGQQ